jgi:O-antigen chain-terminating methyltransferase
MDDKFYRAFEEKYRGSRALISSRLDVYRPFISKLKNAYPTAKGLDLGCGRGEWLEILQDEDLAAIGIDLDDGMLEACKILQLPVEKGDAIAFLSQQPNESLAVISAFHMVEHIAFDQLKTIVSEALRALKPGGLLIMETPNPENFGVGSCNFYLDPTHSRPLPPTLLSFLPEYFGYARTKILRLQEARELKEKQVIGLLDVLSGSSPDYAVVAQKDAVSAILKPFDQIFEKEYGLTTNTLSDYFDAGIQGPIKRMESHQREMNAKITYIEQSRHNLDSQLQNFIHQDFHLLGLDVQRLHHALRDLQANQHGKIAEEMNSLHTRLMHAEKKALRAEHSLNAMRSSNMWRMLAPVRWIGIQLKLLAQEGPISRSKALGQKIRPKVEDVAIVQASGTPESADLIKSDFDNPELNSLPNNKPESKTNPLVDAVFTQLKQGQNSASEHH